MCTKSRAICIGLKFKIHTCNVLFLYEKKNIRINSVWCGFKAILILLHVYIIQDTFMWCFMPFKIHACNVLFLYMHARLKESFMPFYQFQVDSYAYFPPNFEHSIESDAPAIIVVFERRFVLCISTLLWFINKCIILVTWSFIRMRNHAVNFIENALVNPFHIWRFFD